MTICERMFEIIDEKSLKTADLAKKLNIKQSVISNWKKRNTNPPIEYILVICEFLDISVEKLITGENGTTISLEEQKLLNAYRIADSGMKAAARKLLDVQDPEAKSSICVPGKEAV